MWRSQDGLDGSVEKHQHSLWQVFKLPQEVKVVMFSSQLRSWEMVMPRKRKDSKELTGEPPRRMGQRDAGLLLKSAIVVQTEPGHQMINLLHGGGLVSIRDAASCWTRSL